ncbi:MAG: hypothetical protein Q3997_05535 [Propionibacteriaceae bacterium]|nr:hypothetical protein [Propionibacteriaceae bacterium]
MPQPWRPLLAGVCVLLTGCGALGISPPSDPAPSASLDWDAPFATSASAPASSPAVPEPTYECQALPEDIDGKVRAAFAEQGVRPTMMGAVYGGAGYHSGRPFTMVAAHDKDGRVVYLAWTHASAKDGPDLFFYRGPAEQGVREETITPRAERAALACLERA